MTDVDRTELERTVTASSPSVTVEEPNPSRQYQTGNGVPRRYASADELLENAPKDIIEEDVEDVFGGLTVKVRSLTAAQSSQVRQVSLDMRGSGRQQGPNVVFAAMEIAQFEMGLVEPKLSHEQVVMLHRMSGPSFQRVIDKLDEISGIGKEELRKAQGEFQG